MTTPDRTSAAEPATGSTTPAKAARSRRGASAPRPPAGGGAEPKAEPKAKTKTERPPRPPGRPSAKAKRAEAVAGLYASAGLGLDITGQLTGSAAIAADGRAVASVATAAGEAWAEVADTNPAVARVLDNLTTSNAWGGLLMAHVPLVLAMFQNHTPPARPKRPAPTAPTSPASAAAATAAAAAPDLDTEPAPGAEVVAAVLGLAAEATPAPSPVAVA